jgi:tetratricopeptide (TPR) repeat protein
MDLRHHLNALESAGLVRLATVAPELIYHFNHILIEQAAHSSLVKTDRQRLHRQVGQTLEALYPERLDELAPILALHFAAAGDRFRAIDFHRRAARQAQARYAHQEAVQHLRAAVDLLPPGTPPERRADLLEDLAGAWGLLGDHLQALRVYDETLRAWTAQPDPERWGTVRLHRKTLETLVAMTSSVPVDELAPAMLAHAGTLDAGLALAAGQAPHVETVRTLIALSLVRTRGWWSNNGIILDAEAGERYARQAVDMAEALDLVEELSAAWGALAAAYYVRGQLRPRLEIALQRLALSRNPRLANVREKLNILLGAGAALAEVGDFEPALGHLREAEQAATAVHALTPRVYALRLQVQCLFALDRWDDMLRAVEQCRALAREHSTQHTGPICFELALSAAVHTWRGRADLAPALLQESYAIMAAIGGPPEAWVRQQHY